MPSSLNAVVSGPDQSNEPVPLENADALLKKNRLGLRYVESPTTDAVSATFRPTWLKRTGHGPANVDVASSTPLTT